MYDIEQILSPQNLFSRKRGEMKNVAENEIALKNVLTLEQQKSEITSNNEKGAKSETSKPANFRSCSTRNRTSFDNIKLLLPRIGPFSFSRSKFTVL